MKTTYKLILAAFAATAALTACTKDLTTDKVDIDQPDETLRTIAVSFDTPTKSYISGYKDKEYNVQFSLGDLILVSNGTDTEECRVIEKPGSLETTVPQMAIQTKLQGPLMAVYPSDAAKVENYQITGIIVGDMQSGSFADANICTADQNGGIMKSNDALTFTTRVSILRFYADQSIGVDKILIQSKGSDICAEGKTITIDPSYEDSQAEQENRAESAPASRFLYAAVDVSSPVTANELTIRSFAESQGEDYVEKTPTADICLVGNKMYDVFIPYYIKVQVSENPEEYQKWAYCNVGAFLPEEQGLYFAWGATQGYKYDSYEGKFEDDHSFSWDSCPFNNGSTAFNSTYFYGIETEVCPNHILALKYDAANTNWGGKWRMPTQEEFAKLSAGTSSTRDDYCQINNTALIFPFTGNGYSEGLTNWGMNGGYWSSTINRGEYEGEGHIAYRMSFSSSMGLNSQFEERNTGLPIRPIYDETLSDENDPVSLTITAYPNGGTF